MVDAPWYEADVAASQFLLDAMLYSAIMVKVSSTGFEPS